LTLIFTLGLGFGRIGIMETRKMVGSLSSLEAGVLVERERELVDKLFGPMGLTPSEVTELNNVGNRLITHETQLSVMKKPPKVGEFRDTFNGKLVSVRFAGLGWVEMYYKDQDPEADPSVIRRYRIDDFEGMRRMNVVVPTDPMIRSGPVVEQN